MLRSVCTIKALIRAICLVTQVLRLDQYFGCNCNPPIIAHVSISAARSMDVQGVFPYTARSINVQDKRAGRIPFLNAKMSDFLASGQSGTRMNKNADTGTSPVLKEGDPFQYRNAQVPD